MEFFLIIIGLCFGSFLNVLIVRIPLKKSIFFPSSHCPICKDKILWYDNIPLLSWILLKGKCRNCSGRISFIYPTIEILLAILLLIDYFYNKRLYDSNYIFNFISSLTFCSILIVVSFIDMKTFRIPNSANIFAFLAGLTYCFVLSLIFSGTINFNYFLLIRLAEALILYIIFEIFRYFIRMLIGKNAFGGGDSKLISALTIWLGLKSSAITLLISFYLAGIFIFVAYLFKNASRGDKIAFGPFLSSSAYLLWVFGADKIIPVIFPYS